MINSAQFSDYPEIDLTFGRTQMSAVQQLANRSAARDVSEKKQARKPKPQKPTKFRKSPSSYESRTNLSP